MTPDTEYIEIILSLSADDMTDEMLAAYEASGACAETMQHGIDNKLWIPATVTDSEKWDEKK